MEVHGQLLEPRADAPALLEPADALLDPGYRAWVVKQVKYPIVLASGVRRLRQAVSGGGHVLAQVSLRQLLWFPGSNQSNPGRGTWRNKVAAKSIDFVVCDPATLRPLVAVELDEPSHSKPERQGRDEDVEAVLEKAGLPWIRLVTSRTYDTRELAAALAPHLPV